MSSFNSTHIVENYQKRDAEKDQRLYSPFRFEVTYDRMCRLLTLIDLLKKAGINSLQSMKILEIGCGAGGNILELLQIGAQANHITANDLLPERIAEAARRLPSAVHLIEQDATTLTFSENSFDCLLFFTVFSSLLDDAFQKKLADLSWSWLKPGGILILYDFCYHNPRNPDVRKIPLSTALSLFPQARFFSRKVTLAPPLSRRLAPLSPLLCRLIYTLCPFLRTHRLTIIQKPL